MLYTSRIGKIAVVLGVALCVLGGAVEAGGDGIGVSPTPDVSSPLGVSGVDGTGTTSIFPDPTAASPDLGVATVDASVLSTQDGLSLAESPYPLSQVDLSTGAVVGPDINTTLSSDASTTIALAGAGALAIDASSLTAQSAQQQAQQQAASASGCPTSAPPNTLRGGATDVAKLCADSVAQARTPQAADAIKWALNNLGVPYSQPNRNQVGYFDCSSFVSRSYQAAGVPIAPAGANAPTTYTIANAAWAIHEPFSAARPGDLVEPFPDHVVMLLANGYLAQASTTGDVTNVTNVWWSEPYLTVWIDPAKA